MVKFELCERLLVRKKQKERHQEGEDGDLGCRVFICRLRSHSEKIKWEVGGTSTCGMDMAVGGCCCFGEE